MRIDVHAHLFSTAYIDGLRTVFGQDDSPAGQDAQRLIKWMSADPRMTDLEGRLEEMDKWGITMQVLSVPFHGALVRDKPQKRTTGIGCEWKPRSGATACWRRWITAS